jgi:hypothetical protein
MLRGKTVKKWTANNIGVNLKKSSFDLIYLKKICTKWSIICCKTENFVG